MNRIKAIRELFNISQSDLARQAGISQPFLSDLEKGRRGAKPETLKKIADCMGVDVRKLEAG